MEDAANYVVMLIAGPPQPSQSTVAALAALKPYALTCCLPGSEDKVQEQYYKASDVRALVGSLLAGDYKECTNCAGLGCASCHGGASGKEQARA